MMMNIGLRSFRRQIQTPIRTLTAHKGKKIAVVLAGSGVQDGSEIHEAVSVLLSISQTGAEYACFAPNVELSVVDHTTNKETNEKRNVLVESARISRGKITDIEQLNSKDYDAVIFPGGFGAAKNLCTFASDKDKMTINEHVERVLKDFHTAKKPIGLCCISPVIAAKVFPGCSVTIGSDEETAKAIETMGSKNVVKKVDEVQIDKTNLIVTTPAYMLGPSIEKVFEGVNKMVKNVLQLSKDI